MISTENHSPTAVKQQIQTGRTYRLSLILLGVTIMQGYPRQGVIIEIDSDTEDLESSEGDSLGFNEIEDNYNDGKSDDSALLRFGGIPEPPDLWQPRVDESDYYEACLTEILEVFPDICHAHVRKLYDVELQKVESDSQRANISQVLILSILDEKTYPKEKDRINELKRKRSNMLDSDEEEAANWNDLDRGQGTDTYLREAYVRFDYVVRFDFVACCRVLCLATKSETVDLEIHHSRVTCARCAAIHRLTESQEGIKTDKCELDVRFFTRSLTPFQAGSLTPN